MKAFSAMIGAASGGVFGFALEKGDVHRPLTINRQMKMQKFTMMKMFLTAAGTGAVAIAAMHASGLAPLTGIKPVWPLANVAGGALLGAGMTICGACPGTVFAQLGSGIPTAPYVLLGGLVGTAAYSLVHPWVASGLMHRGLFGLTGTMTVSGLTGLPHWALAACLASGMFIGLFLIEKLLAPTKRETPDVKGGLLFDANLQSSRWSPYWSGFLIGMLQIPSLMLVGASLGTSTSYVGATRLLLEPVANAAGVSLPTYLASATFGAKDLWQMALDVSIAVGAFVSASMSGNLAVNRRQPISLRGRLLAVLGGALLLFGARMANGCTSGHGLSGVSQLAISSLLATPAMFAGGMLVAALFPNVCCVNQQNRLHAKDI